MIALYELVKGDGKMPSRAADAEAVVKLMMDNGYTLPPEDMREMFKPVYGKSLVTFVDARKWCAINILNEDFPARLEIAGHKNEVVISEGKLVKLLNEHGYRLR